MKSLRTAVTFGSPETSTIWHIAVIVHASTTANQYEESNTGTKTDSPQVESFTAHHRPETILNCHSWTVAGFPLPDPVRPWTAHRGELWGRYCCLRDGYGGWGFGIGATELSGGESVFAHARVALRGGLGAFVVGAMQVQAAPQTQWRVAPGSSS
jgi:hypothetical protein